MRQQLAYHDYSNQPAIRRASLPQTPVATRYKAPTIPDEEEDEEQWSYRTKAPRSAIVYRRPYAQVEPITRTDEGAQPPRGGNHPMLYVGVSLLIVVVFIIGYLTIPPALQRWSDERTYGYPRTYQTDANVGHGGISHFIVLNSHGTIEVIETPQDLTRGIHMYIIIHFSSDGADLIPATVSFSDLNGDGKPDMEVKIYETPGNPSIWLLFNDGTTFKPHV